MNGIKTRTFLSKFNIELLLRAVWLTKTYLYEDYCQLRQVRFHLLFYYGDYHHRHTSLVS